MKELKIKSSKEYKVLITSKTEEISSRIKNDISESFFIVTDENVYNLHKAFIDSLGNSALGLLILKPGEEIKNMNSIIKIYDSLIKLEVNKGTSIVSIGGGVVGDLCGFAASTYMRGIGLVHIPTSLMAQCDSSVGGKTGFNYEGIKNVIGTFYQPDFVYMDVNFLKTLSNEEFKNGLAEIIKYGYVCDSDLFFYIEKYKKDIKERETRRLLEAIYECIRIKGSIVEKDERDTNARHVLNFGHTIGHGIESACDFRIAHGKAVAIGMSIESSIGLRMGLTDYNSHNRLVNLLKYFELPYRLDEINVPIERILDFTKKDKKNTMGSVKFVLPHNLGHAIITTDVKKDTIYEILNEMVG